MLRSDFVMKLMSIVLFVAIATYIGIYIFNAADKPLVTTLAAKYIVEDSGSAEGYIVRVESVLKGDGSTVTLMAGEGDKLASGQAVAVDYEGQTALELASEIRALQLEINAAEEAASVSSNQKILDADTSILALSKAVQHKNLSGLEDLTLGIKKIIFTNSAGKISDADLAVLKDRLTNLFSKNSDAKTIYSPMSGVFSAVVDGYESIGPDKLENLTPSSLQALFSETQDANGAVLGKLITGITWYYAAVMDEPNARKLDSKTTAALKFTKSYNAHLEMKIVSIGAEENGKCVVVFSAKRSVSDMTVLRKLTAQIEFSSYSGLLIPKEAVKQPPTHAYHGNESKTYIYILTGQQAEKVYIDILSENGDSYIVRDETQNGTILREGTEIIVKAKDIYDGKVVG